MRFLKTLFNRSTHISRRTLNKRSKTLSLESLEQRIALDAAGVRPQLEPVREVHIDNSLVGPDPVVFGKSELIGQHTKSFVITSVAAGSMVEKLDVSTNQWRNVSAPVTTSNPSELIRLMRLRVIQEGDQVRWLPKSTDGVTQKAFEIIGWDDGSETTEPEGINLPGAVENLELNIVGDEVQVTWDPPASGAAVTHYRIHQNPTTVVPSTQTSHTFAKVASPASYAVTVHANSADGAGEATTVTVSTGSYQKIDGTVVDPILDTSGKVLDYDGPNLKPNAKLKNVNLKDADLNDANLTGAYLFGADLTIANLTGADLTGAVLTVADLSGADLFNAQLTGAILTYADLIGTTLTGAELAFADLRGADLSGADLSNVISGQTKGDGSTTLPTNWQLIKGYLIGPGANLTIANLTGADLTGADLTGANLTGVNLTNADLTNVKSGGITYNGTPPILPTNWQLIDGYLIGPGADLKHANLLAANLQGANLSGADLTGADLTGAVLTGADLRVADLSGADLFNAQLTGAILTYADLIGTTLTGAELAFADLRGADLSGADLSNVISGYTKGDGSTTLPTNWQLIKGYLIGPGANLTIANLTGADLTGADLTGANLTGVNLTNADLTNVKSGGITYNGTPPILPTNWQLIDGYLIGPTADLTGADLTGVDLTGVNLTNADLTNATLTGATLTGVTLHIVKSGGITYDGTPPTLPTDWQLIDGYLIGPTANLNGATLTSQDLSGANLTNAYLINADLIGADLSGADLTNATLINVKSGGITGDGSTTLPTNWQLIEGYLIGPGADLTGADLTGADLTGADLTGADLGWARLTNATLTGATLTGVTLHIVKSGGITYDGTPPTLPTDWQLIDGYLIGPTANLNGATLTSQDLSGANLTNAYLINADLIGADLSGADLTNATLINVKSGGITGDGSTTLPTNWQLIEGYLIGPGADLTGADLTGADLTGADLTGADLGWARLTNATLTGATLTGVTLHIVKSGGITYDGTPPTLPTDWQLIDGYLIGPTANLNGATLTSQDLSGANLTNAYLINADLIGADLSGADLTNATLINVKSGGITGDGSTTLPTNWQLIEGYLIGPGADLTGADLTGADLTGADLTGADLGWARLTNATLTGATLTGVTLHIVKSGGITYDGTPPTLPTDWQLIDGYLIGPTANLNGATLTSQDLSGANLTNAYLINAHLNGVNLTGANLSGANLAGVSGAAKYNSATILPAGFDPVAAGWTLVS